jgi:hypothetical protein
LGIPLSYPAQEKEGRFNVILGEQFKQSAGVGLNMRREGVPTLARSHWGHCLGLKIILHIDRHGVDKIHAALIAAFGMPFCGAIRVRTVRFCTDLFYEGRLPSSLTPDCQTRNVFLLDMELRFRFVPQYGEPRYVYLSRLTGNTFGINQLEAVFFRACRPAHRCRVADIVQHDNVRKRM